MPTLFPYTTLFRSEEKQDANWKVERNDYKNIQFIFGNVRYRRTLMYDDNGKPHYPLDSWLGFRKKQRYSPLVEVKVAELASDSTYRESSRILNERSEERRVGKECISKELM